MQLQDGTICRIKSLESCRNTPSINEKPYYIGGGLTEMLLYINKHSAMRKDLVGKVIKLRRTSFDIYSSYEYGSNISNDCIEEVL